MNVYFYLKYLKNKYNLDVTVQSSGKNKEYILYIKKNSYKDFVGIVKPFIIPSMYYKLNL